MCVRVPHEPYGIPRSSKRKGYKNWRLTDWLSPKPTRKTWTSLLHISLAHWISGHWLHHTNRQTKKTTNHSTQIEDISCIVVDVHIFFGLPNCIHKRASARKRKTQLIRRIVHTHWIISTALYQPFFCRHSHTKCHSLLYFSRSLSIYVCARLSNFYSSYVFGCGQTNCEFIDEPTFLRFT